MGSGWNTEGYSVDQILSPHSVSLHQVLIEELEQKLHACHNRGLDSIEAPGEIPGQESSQTPVPGPAKKRPVAGMFFLRTVLS